MEALILAAGPASGCMAITHWHAKGDRFGQYPAGIQHGEFLDAPTA